MTQTAVAQIDVAALIERACLDEGLRAAASIYFGRLIADGALLPKPREGKRLRGSDMGRCARELAYELRKTPALPRDFRTQLAKLDEGSLMGAWAASLLRAAAESEGWHCELEADVNQDDMPGHIDATVYDLSDSGAPRIHLVEFKWSFGGYPAEPPDTLVTGWKAVDRFARGYQVYQATKYGLGAHADWAYVVTVSPAAKKDAPWLDVSPYDPQQWVVPVANEIARLSKALGDELPEGDPQHFWRCGTCPYPQCERHPKHVPSLELTEADLV